MIVPVGLTVFVLNSNKNLSILPADIQRI